MIISTPLNTHAAIAADAIDTDVHVYCEKTMVKGDEDTLKLYKKLKNNHKNISNWSSIPQFSIVCSRS